MVRAAGAGEGQREATGAGAAAEEQQPKLASTVKRMLGMDDAAIVVRGQDDLMVYRSKCCNPIPGDDIIGYVTRGRGIAVHSKNCPNVENLLYEAERRIAVEWAESHAGGISGAPAHHHRGSARHDRRNHQHHQRNRREYSQL